MFNKRKEETIPVMTFLTPGVYRFSLPFFLGHSIPLSDEGQERRVYHFPVDAYIHTEEVSEKGIAARFVINGGNHGVPGGHYESLATILRRSYFTQVLMETPPEQVKWILYFDAEHGSNGEEEIFEKMLKWDEKTSNYYPAGQKLLTSVFD
ncbi:hypothetical protein ACSU6B_17415 [Neobacillus sp. C211]|uniref:hypothetical protein n=1 Tax=unclassified Neobacillus TaxID=2675272 RepID=UPI00397AEB57